MLHDIYAVPPPCEAQMSRTCPYRLTVCANTCTYRKGHASETTANIGLPSTLLPKAMQHTWVASDVHRGAYVQQPFLIKTPCVDHTPPSQ